MSSENWPGGHYETLFDVWHLWLSQAESDESQWPILDRWLKRSIRNLRTDSRPAKFFDRPQKPSASLTLADQLAISTAMFSAMRFVQLGCALEQSYRAGAPLNWAEWDRDWRVVSVSKIPPAAFWYWIALRCNSGNMPPKVLRDAAARKAWFSQMQAAMPLLQNGELNAAGLLWHGLRPQWLPLLQERRAVSGWTQNDLHHFVVMQNEKPPLWLRVQSDVTPVELQQGLVQAGVVSELVDEQFLCAKGGADVTLTEIYRKGLVEIQDLASQQIAARVNVQPGQKVWDACAGAGGKSLAIAAGMGNKGVVVATDLHSYKLDELKRRAKRAEFFNIRTFTWEGDEPLRLPKEVAQQQGFDWVLVDSPCSSSGTWRRNPDARWRFKDDDTADLLQLQQKIVKNASVAVRKGGHLVYASCSWQVSENEQQVEHFLAEHQDFSLVSQSILGAPQQDTDTMFVAVLIRNK